MKQTAMQEMIKKLEEKRDMWKADGKLSDRQIRGTYVIAILIAKELLELEKQQIMDALKEGVNFEIDNSHSTQINYNKYFEKYYNETFKNQLQG